MNGIHHSYDGIASKRPRIVGVQCRRCLVRLSGPLAGWRSEQLLPDYAHVDLCTACEFEVTGQMPPRQHIPRRKHINKR